eukprot:TRINITY_DN74138_c0_g1_i1.p1 TRINITY_DN74138_c0_g1~~TRINITY_DN74138_c0_g1_i1.p1  ORF type:complete len:282 (-),score=45.33 TRINITY_DN74138_c0_g1_i1:402-1247(-)
MSGTRVVDVDAEGLLRHFCLEKECEDVRDWFAKEGFTRPEECDKRVELGIRLKDIGNSKFLSGDHLSAMMHGLGALYCLDFSQANYIMQTDEEKVLVRKTVVPVLSNLSIVFQKRGDAYNSLRAADLGLEYVKKLPSEVNTGSLRAKLTFRRGLAKGQKREFEAALVDLREAAKLVPTDRDVRRALENCKLAIQQERGGPDDRWRGLLTDTPEKARSQAKDRRWWRDMRLSAKIVKQSIVENRKVCVIMLLGPVLSLSLPALVAWGGATFRGNSSTPFVLE